MNKYLLSMHMAKHGDDQQKLAEALGITRVQLNRKINEHGGVFNKNEMTFIRDRYHLTDEEFASCFFAENVS